MDDPAIDPAVHDRALAGLRRLNAAARSHSPIARAIVRLLPRQRDLVLGDVATGSGDVALAVAKRLRARGLGVQLVLYDISAHALGEAARRCEAAGIPASCVQCDATTNSLATPNGLVVDIAMCSLFLHHLDESAATRVLAHMQQIARVGGVVSDLRRSRVGLVLAWLASRALTQSRVVHIDAIRSVRAGWSVSEFSRLAASAGLDDASIMRAWPQRLILSWRSRGSGDG